jgi:spore germination protein Q
MLTMNHPFYTGTPAPTAGSTYPYGTGYTPGATAMGYPTGTSPMSYPTGTNTMGYPTGVAPTAYPGSVTPGMTSPPPVPSGGYFPGAQSPQLPPTPGLLPIESSYIENILRLNLGKVATIYMTFENNSQWNAKVFKGVVEAAGRDHIIISDPQTGMRYLLLMVNLDYVTFDEELQYTYPY